ncbi:low-density lipoprotein receptor-related protein 11 isoform 2-T2 [Vipera latastei]
MAAEVPGPPGLLVLWLLPPLLLLLGAPAASTGELRSPAASGVESLLEEFRRQLQLERDPSGGRSNEQLEEAAGHCRGGAEGPAGGGGSFFSVRSDSIIRTKDSIAAGATFLGSPSSVAGPRHCLDACCADARCTVAVLQQQQQQQQSTSVRCYLFSCTYRGRAVCVFSPQRGYNSYFLEPTSHPPALDTDEPPLSKAGEDIILQLPVDWVILDGRESVDDHGITRYEWTLLQGASSVDMQVPQPGTLKLSHMQEGKYTLQLTVTDTAGQRSSDNVSVTLLPLIHSELGCVGKCSRYQFLCDDGCCIDITYACDGEIHCPDGSDEAFCQKYNSGQNAITHIETIQQNSAELMKKTNEHLIFEITQTSTLSSQVLEPEKIKQSPSRGPKKQIARFIPDSRISGKDTDKKNDNDIVGLKSTQIEKSLPVPETGAVLPLALGLAITALLLLMVACRLRLVRQKLKKARPTTFEESDYLINGMYL